MRVMIIILVLVTLQNIAKADEHSNMDNVQTIERCEHLASNIMNDNDEYSDDMPDAVEMDALECNELGDFFN
jgi:hypothetical protein